MTNTVLTKVYNAPPIEKREILRYAGCPAAAELELLDDCIGEIKGKLSYKICYREFDICRDGIMLDLGFVKAASEDLIKNLHDCGRIIVFAATVGLEIDRLIEKYCRLSPTKALLFQAIGAERIESLCNAFCAEMGDAVRTEGRLLKPRFSPGYGDLPLELQRDIFAVLDCPRKIGLTLNNSLLMSPSKSVTAIVGITENKTEYCVNKCGMCGNSDCTFRG